MEDTPLKKIDAKPSGRRYATVDEFLKGEMPVDIADGVRKLADETRLTRILAALRVKAGFTQETMGEKMVPSRTQGTISKLESGLDEDLTLSDIREYSRILNERIGFAFGPSLNHVEAIKGHALSMKNHMIALAKLAHLDEEMGKDIQAFFGEAFFNILTILGTCQGQMSEKNISDFKFEIVEPAALSKPIVKRETRETVFV